MNVKQLAVTIAGVADHYSAECEVISVKGYGGDGSSVLLTVDAGYDGTHEQVLYLKGEDKKKEETPCQNGN